MSLGKTVTYTGEVLDCVKQGKGSYKYPGGVYTYEGPWVDGKKQGSGGKFTLLGGSTYEGDFNAGEMTGKGTKSWADGRTYTGDFVSGELCGRGTWTSADGTEVYEGEFRDNRREGQGFNRLPGGDTYNGTFSRHRFHGPGAYLRENCFIVTSTFEAGIIQGVGVVNWHKVASYEGAIVNGGFQGFGRYTAFNGSYRYEGNFENNCPDYQVNKLHLFLDKSFIASDHVEDEGGGGGKGKKKAPAKAKKSDAAGDVLATVSAGHELGKLIFLMSTNKSSAEVSGAEEWKMPLSVPNPAELRRSMRVRLREYFPPPPPAKGEPVKAPNPDTELGAILPLWQRKASAETKSGAWERFPVSNSIRYIDGVDVLTGNQVCTEGGTTAFVKDELSGVTAAAVPPSDESSLSISFVPAALPHADERLALLTDFKLTLDDPTTCATTELNNLSFSEIPILSLCNKVEGLEGKSRLELVLLRPTSMRSEDKQMLEDGIGKGGSLWSGCVWELHLCELVEQPFEEPSVEEKEEEKEERGEKDDLNAEPPAPVFLPTKTVLCRWADSASFDSASWHSIALTLQSSSGGDRGVEGGGGGNASGGQGSSSGGEEVGNVELTVDGTGRMKMEVGGGQEGIATAWLPVSKSHPATDHTNVDNTNIDTGAEKFTEEIDVQGGGETEVSMVFRVGRGENFSGLVKSLVLVAGKQGNAQAMTAAFLPDRTEEKDDNATVLSKDKDKEEGGEEPISVPADCAELKEVEIVSCGGRGSVDGLLIPASTPPGTYVLEVLDNVDPRCLRVRTSDADVEPDPPGPESVGGGASVTGSVLTAGEQEGGDNTSSPLLPGDLACLCQLVPPAGSSLVTFKVAVCE